MRKLCLMVLGFNLLYAQGKYIEDECGLAISTQYGRVQSSDQWDFSASYSFKGRIDLSFTRTNFVHDTENDHFQNEFYLGTYVFKSRRLFLSAGLGFISNEANADLWQDFPLQITHKGPFYQSGVHTSLGTSKSPRLVSSLYYRYTQVETEIVTILASQKMNDSLHNVGFESVFVLTVERIDFLLGPHAVVELDGGDILTGLKLSVMLRH